MFEKQIKRDIDDVFFYFKTMLLASPGQSFGKRLINKYELKEKIANFKVLLSRAVQDQRLLKEELIAINTYFFGSVVV